MPRPLARRTLLMGGAVALAGCGALPLTGSPPDRMDLHIVNQSDHPIEYDLSIHRPAAEPFFERSGELGADDEAAGDDNSVAYGNPITEPGEYQLRMQTSNGLDIAFRWDDRSEPAEQRPDHDGITLNLYADTWNVEWADQRVES